MGAQKGIETLPVPEKSRGRTGKRTCNLLRGKRITKKAHAGRVQETKREIPIKSDKKQKKVVDNDTGSQFNDVRLK